ncbi:hypothetical protein P170DRAFT_467015 [Aspergillus steynii IBT 23096]|uniref:WD40 repeat-like protein n=1 Tax=Aspergillus steynii IBT 23096 TaxID=1392250 RepID=A0A2I2FYU0_9EURO|nr:uncharacterized protein P170DRAFT_467015 [Aspergillus steynii IBT 23096]PLB45802.1 hypothetical protein P170DRAFT_467015 [Aspergillus steynii IBT 23096]
MPKSKPKKEDLKNFFKLPFRKRKETQSVSQTTPLQPSHSLVNRAESQQDSQSEIQLEATGSSTQNALNENHDELEEQRDETDDSVEYEWGKLWEAAYQQLSEKEKILMDAYRDALLKSDNTKSFVASRQQEDREEQLKSLAHYNLKRIENATPFKLRFKDTEVVLKEEVDRLVHGIIAVKDVISAAISGEPHASLAWAGVLVGLNQSEHAAERSYMPEQACHGSSAGEGTIWLKKKVVSIYTLVFRYQIRFAKRYFQSSVTRYFKDLATVDDWQSMWKDIEQSDDAVSKYLQAKSNATTQDIHDNVQKFYQETQSLLDEANKGVKASSKPRLRMANFTILNGLRPLMSAAYNSGSRAEIDGQCLKGTQEAVLNQIQSWIDDSQTPPIFWLHGMAGTGKSTIARTVASALDRRERLDSKGSLPDEICLGGTFFFRRTQHGHGQATALFRTLARQLVEALPDLAQPICDVIEQNYDIASEIMLNQWRDLVLHPLRDLGKRLLLPLTVILVVDALDECLPETSWDSKSAGQSLPENNIHIIVNLLGQVRELETSHVRVKIFITSRPTDEIGFRFGQLPADNHKSETLLKVPLPRMDDARKDDITRFLGYKLHRIRQIHSRKEDWPGPEKTIQLVLKADGLFIYAATIYRYMEPLKADLDMRLTDILENKIDDGSPQEDLDRLYITILKTEVIGNVTKRERLQRASEFKRIVGYILILSDSLPIHVLSNLVSSESRDMTNTVEEMVRCLHSVLAMSESGRSIELLHLSFRDFLVNRERCGDEFWIDEKRTNLELFERCIEIMSSALKKNVCQFERINVRIEDVKRETLGLYLPEHVQYACCYWVYHLQQSDFTSSSTDKLHGFLKEHFTHWIEAMSLMRKVSLSILVLNDLLNYISTLSTHIDASLSEFVQDAKRFTVYFRSVIEQAPLQLLDDEIALWDTATWRRVQLLKHESSVHAMSFSPDCKSLASSAGTKVRIWHLATGLSSILHEDNTPENDTMAYHMQFSPDGERLVVVFVEGRGLICNPHQKGVLVSFQLFSSASPNRWRPFISAFSPDNRLLLFYFVILHSSDRWHSGAEVWNAVEGVRLQTFESAARGGVSFSPDGKQVWSASTDGRVQIWDSITGSLQEKMNIGPSIAASFSSDVSKLVSLSTDHQVRVWDPAAAKLLRILPGFSSHENIDEPCVDFLSPSSESVTASTFSSLYVWDTATGKSIVELFLPDFLGAGPAFSPNGKLVACGNKIWDCLTPMNQTIDQYQGQSRCHIISPDGTLMVFINRDVLQVRDANLTILKPALAPYHWEFPRARFSVGGKRLITVDRGPLITIWDSGTWDPLQTFRLKIPDGYTPGESYSFQISLDSMTAVYSLEARDGIKYTIGLWHLAVENSFLAIGELDYPLSHLALSSDGSLVASISKDNRVHIWNANSGEVFKTLGDHVYGDLAFSPDNKFIASGGSSLILWDIETGAKCRQVQDQSWHETLSFSQDGQWLLTSRGQFPLAPVFNPCFDLSKKGISRDEEWLLHNGKEMILLPPDEQDLSLRCPDPSLVRENFVVADYGRGAVIEFDDNEESGLI